MYKSYVVDKSNITSRPFQRLFWRFKLYHMIFSECRSEDFRRLNFGPRQAIIFENEKLMVTKRITSISAFLTQQCEQCCSQTLKSQQGSVLEHITRDFTETSPVLNSTTRNNIRNVSNKGLLRTTDCVFQIIFYMSACGKSFSKLILSFWELSTRI